MQTEGKRGKNMRRVVIVTGGVTVQRDWEGIGEAGYGSVCHL